MTINKLRSILYATARYMGDVQAVQQEIKGNRGAIGRRIVRRAAGRQTGKLLGALFRVLFK